MPKTHQRSGLGLMATVGLWLEIATKDWGEEGRGAAM